MDAPDVFTLVSHPWQPSADIGLHLDNPAFEPN
jgi:hypothetical protein